MSGFMAIKRMQDLIADAKALGFEVAPPQHRAWDEVLSLRACDDALPIYSRDRDIFIGTVDQAESWLRGIRWARDYDRMIRLSTEQRRQRREQDFRNQKLARILRTSGEVAPT